MTHFAYDAARQMLVRTIPTPFGDDATDFVAFTPNEPQFGPLIAKGLTTVSETFWRSFTHPASSAQDDLSPNTEGWRRDITRAGLAAAITALANPNLPSHGMVRISYISTVEAGHWLGRLLVHCEATQLRSAIVAEVQAEADAIDRAEAGDLTGRSQQAATLSRPIASPLQVNAAHEVLKTDPFASPPDFAGIEPASAAVAAAHWLRCAAKVASRVSGVPYAQVVCEADEIEALPWETPTAVLQRIRDGESPEEVVTSLIKDALDVADGDVHMLMDFDAMPSVIDPGPDLLEDLLTGIHGALLLWNEYDPTGDDGPLPDDDDEYWESQFESRRVIFAEAVRRRAVKSLRG